MDDMMTSTDDTVFTEEDKQTVEAGGEVEIKMEVKENPAPEKKDEIDQKVEESLNASATVELYIDLDLTKTVRDADGAEQSSTAITQSNVLLENIIFLPGHLQGKDAYHVFRQHGSQVTKMERLDAPCGKEGFVVNEDKTTITIYSYNYSTFAIATTEFLTISFDANGGSVTPASGTTNEDSNLSSLPTPVRTGYAFQGWYTEKTGGIKVTTATVFKTDTTVYAQWSPVNYTVTIAGTENGTVTADVTGGTMGTAVTITVTPKSGYRLSTLTVKDSSGNSYTVSTDNNGKYYFTMPSADVTVTATFTKISTVVADPTNPKTGDDFQIVFWNGMMMTSLFGMAVLLMNKKKFLEK